MTPTETFYLSYLMGAEGITDRDISSLGITIEDNASDGDRALKIPKGSLVPYIKLIKQKLTNGFWNELVGDSDIMFIFKHKDGSIKEYKLSPENEKEIAELCSAFASEKPEKTANVCKYISNNKFYHDFMIEHYGDMIN